MIKWKRIHKMKDLFELNLMGRSVISFILDKLKMCRKLSNCKASVISEKAL